MQYRQEEERLLLPLGILMLCCQVLLMTANGYGSNCLFSMLVRYKQPVIKLLSILLLLFCQTVRYLKSVLEQIIIIENGRLMIERPCTSPPSSAIQLDLALFFPLAPSSARKYLLCCRSVLSSVCLLLFPMTIPVSKFFSRLSLLIT